MDFFSIVESIALNFYQEHLYIVIALGVLFLFLLFRKPKIFFAILSVVLIIAGALYLISTLSSTGTSQKERLLHKEDRLYDNYMQPPAR